MALGQSAALSSARSGLAMSGGGVAGTAGPAGEEAEGEVHVPAGQHDYSHIDRSQVDSVGKQLMQGGIGKSAPTGKGWQATGPLLYMP